MALMLNRRIFIYFSKFKNSIVFKTKENNKIKIFPNQIKYRHSEVLEIKRKIIEFEYLNKISLDNTYKNHLFNYLIMNDSGIHRKACLIKYLLERKNKIKKISAPFLNKEDQALFLFLNVEVKKIKSNTKLLLPVSMISLLINTLRRNRISTQLYPEEKSILNPSIKYLRILKVFNANIEKIYLNKLNETLENTIIYVKPYIHGIRFKRQQENIQQLIKERRDFFFYAPRIKIYRVLKKAIYIYFSQIPDHIKVPLLSIIIQRFEVDDFVNYLKKKFLFVREFYTSEEFETQSIYLTERLQNENIKVVNFAHGLGVYNIIANYDTFYVFSKIQSKYYLGTSKFKFYNQNLPLAKKETKDKNKEFVLFFIHQNVFSMQVSNNDMIIYRKVIDFIERIANDYKFPVYAKYHPASSEIDKVFSKNINIIEKVDDLPSEKKILAVSSFSTYVIELLNVMPFLLINPNNKLRTNYIFPTNNLLYVKSYDEFKQRIDKFINNPNHFDEYWNSVIDILEKEFFN